MKRKLTTLAILMAMLLSVFTAVSAADTETIWKTVLEDDFGGDLSKWTNVTEGFGTTDGTLDFNGYSMGWLEPNVNEFSDSVSVEFDMIKPSTGLNIRLRDEDNTLLLLSFKGYYDVNACEISDYTNYIPFGASLLPNEPATVQYVINSDGITMYTKEIGENDSAYTKHGEAYDDTAIDMFKEGKGLQVDAIYYQSALSQPEDKTFNVGEELVTMTVYPVVMDNIKIKHAKYGTQHFASAFSDDFSSGNLDKWTNESNLFAVNEDGKVGMNVFNAYLKPNVEPSKNLMLQFDATGWMSNFYIQFTDPEDAANNFRCTLHPIVLNSWAQLWDGGDTWIDYAYGCGIDGGTDEMPKLNSIRYILCDGVLSVYIKTENDVDFVYKGSHSYEENDGVISGTASYVPNFYVIGSQDAAEAEKVLLDNVVIKTIPENSATMGAKTTAYTFDTAESMNDWNVPAWYFNGTEFQSDRPAYTWNEDGTVFMYIWGGTAYPVNPVSANEFVTELTYIEPDTGNKSIYLQYTNTADETDYVRVRIADWCVCVTDETGAEVTVTGGPTIFTPGSKTVKFDLASDKLTITGGDTTSVGTLDGENFAKYFTENAEYKVGIYTVIASNATPVNIDSLVISVPATTTVTAKLMAATAKDVYEISAFPATGEKCRVKVDADGTFAGTFIAALYDGGKLVSVKTGTDAKSTFDFSVPETAVKPVVKVMTWENLEGGMPMSGAFVFTAE